MTAPLALPPETLAAFNGDELRARVYWEKYSLRGSDGEPTERAPQEMWDRVATGLAAMELDAERRIHWQREFRWLLDGFRFLPGGRILHAVGQAEAGRKAVPINCFILPIKGDTIEDIYECAKEMAKTYSRGGGVGVDISALRPKGAVVHNASHASTGAVSFMETFSLVTGTIGQSGRRGALMITIRDDHPDVLDFVRIKRNKDKVRFANISVLVSDAFMRAVEQDADWRLHFENPTASVFVQRTIKARELWNELIQGARDWAEPGCLFIDTARRLGTTEYNGMNVLTTNPCVSGDTLVSTTEGLIRISDLAQRTTLPDAVLDTRVSAALPSGVIVRAWKSGYKPVFRITTNDGYELRATGDHKILTVNRGLVQVNDLTPQDLLLIQNRFGGFGTQGNLHVGRVIGWIVGDGHVAQTTQSAVLEFYGAKKILASAMQESVAAVATEHRAPKVINVPTRDRADIRSTHLLVALKRYGFDETDKYRIPDTIWQGSEEMVRGFLQGLFTADGTVLNASAARRSVRLASSKLGLLKDVQRLLVNFGIPSRIYENRRPHRVTQLPDGHGGTRPYACLADHELVISKHALVLFAQVVGFLPESDKQGKLDAMVAAYVRKPFRNTFTTRITRITPDGVDAVYDLTEAVSHTFIANGLTISNCGEQFLDPYNNCDLGSINLLSFVREPFAALAAEENLDWDALRRAVRAGVRFLDNVLTYADPLFPLDAQREAARRSRRIGLGITGLGDFLASLRLRYDSDEAIAFTGRLMEFIKASAYEASTDLAEEKGPFPAFDADKHLGQEFFRRLPRALLDRIRTAGLRNAALMTVPPTGSISAMAGVTSGIEPIFALTYIRRSESLSQDHFTVVHPLVEAYFRSVGQQEPDLRSIEHPDRVLQETLPDFFMTAHEIDPLQRVRMQAAIAKHVDNSVSSTINLRRDVSVETVEQVYRLAWQLGCKGITVYREGSREGVLLTTDEAKRGHQLASLADHVTAIAQAAIPSVAERDGRGPEQQIERIVQVLTERVRQHPEQLELISQPTGPMRDRPQALEGVTYRIPLDRLGTLFVTVNEHEGEPFEVFCRLGKSSADTEAQAEADGRLMSLVLRMAGPVPQQARLEEIIHQLEGIGGSISIGFGPNRVRSIPDGIARALRLYLERSTPGEPPAGPPIPTSNGADTIDLPEDREALPAIAGGSNGQICPRCQRYTLVTDQGCSKCECGYKEC